MKGLEKRLAIIQANFRKGYQHKSLEDMTCDELAQVITGNPDARASELSSEYLESVIQKVQQCP